MLNLVTPRAVSVMVISAGDVQRLSWIARLATAAALIGHGGYGAVMGKEAWLGYFAVLGLDPATATAASLIAHVGWFEIVLGLWVLVWPVRALLLGVLLWKVFTEFLRPLAGEPIWEFIERGANMVAPLALLYLRGWPTTLKDRFR